MTIPAHQPNVYQLSGLDDRERGFTRQVTCLYRDEAYYAALQYERVKIEEHSTIDESSALLNVITTLQTCGYTQLRSQLIFRGETYLGSEEFWVDYPDREVEKPKLSVLERLRRWFNRRKDQKTPNRSSGQC